MTRHSLVRSAPPQNGWHKAIIFDASTLISLAMNGLLPELKELKKIFDGKFMITEDVKKEVIDKPLTIKKFELEALKLKQLLDEKVLELPSSAGIKENEIQSQTDNMMKIANEIFTGEGDKIHLISAGETSCLALSKILDNKKITNVIAVDERTTRMLVEKPDNLKELLQRKLHTRITLNKKNFSPFKGFKIIRSAELVYVAYKKGVVRLKDGDKVLDALLWAVKFKGCSISNEEIDEIQRIR
ncbi:MAG: hypothetical protein KJ721_00370 [Nanoarchaeota archaeon]|nr:hypothetical protein [Nanoarchaeota archaeon]